MEVEQTENKTGIKRKLDDGNHLSGHSDANSKRKNKKLKRQEWKLAKKAQKQKQQDKQKHGAGAASDDFAMTAHTRAHTHANAKPFVDVQSLNETSYYFAQGQRHVVPYFYTYRTNAKKRWFGRALLDVYCEEFAAFSPDYYKAAIESGRITVCGERVSCARVVRNGDTMEHATHRHEKPVSAEPVRVVHQTPRVLVVSKPALLPIHPVGRFRHNSLLFVLAKEHNLTNLHVVHRLDRCTSGLVILARDPRTAHTLMTQFMARHVNKQYLARVCGCFPESEQTVNRPIVCLSAKYAKFGCVSADDTESMTEREGKDRDGDRDRERDRDRDRDKGKAACTVFRRLAYDKHSNTSLVLCLPQTGRTHQIRVHLAFLGHPIANDARYQLSSPVSSLTLTHAQPQSQLLALASDSDGKQPAHAHTAPHAPSHAPSHTPSQSRVGWPAELSAAEVSALLQASVDPHCAECADSGVYSFARKFPMPVPAVSPSPSASASGTSTSTHTSTEGEGKGDAKTQTETAKERETKASGHAHDTTTEAKQTNDKETKAHTQKQEQKQQHKDKQTDKQKHKQKSKPKAMKIREFGQKSSVFEREEDSMEAAEGVEGESELWLHAFAYTCTRDGVRGDGVRETNGAASASVSVSASSSATSTATTATAAAMAIDSGIGSSADTEQKQKTIATTTTATTTTTTTTTTSPATSVNAGVEWSFSVPWPPWARAFGVCERDYVKDCVSGNL